MATAKINPYERGTPVFSMGRTLLGRLTGGQQDHCGCEGCTGTPLGVRWSNGTLTFTCTKGMLWHDDPGCWEIVEVRRREWVFTKAGTQKEIGACGENECRSAEDAYHQFSRECAEDFDIYFRTKDGTLHSVAGESTPEDFPEPSELPLKGKRSITP